MNKLQKGLFRLSFIKNVFLLLIVSTANAQNGLDSIHVNHNEPRVLQKMIVPTTLIVGSLLISGSDFEKRFQTDIRNAVGEDFKSEFDNSGRYLPLFQMYAADVLGVKSRNHWFDQTKNLVLAVVVTDLITTTMKRSIDKKRPGAVKESFPSAHTSLAFTNAGILYQEFIHSSPLLAYSGFTFATATGALRVMKNTHWVSDVLMGAGIGLLVTKVIYLFEPIIKWNPFLKDPKWIHFIPRFSGEQYGFYMSMDF